MPNNIFAALVFAIENLRGSSHPDVLCKKGVLRNFTKFTGKHLCQSLFLNKVSGKRYINIYIFRCTKNEFFRQRFGHIYWRNPLWQTSFFAVFQIQLLWSVILSSHKKVKFSSKDLFSRCEQIRIKLQIYSHLLKKSSMDNVIFMQCLIQSLII